MGIRTARASEAITAEAKRPGRRRVARGATAATGAIAMMLACASVAWACTWAAADTFVVPWDPSNSTTNASGVPCPHVYPLMPNDAPPVFRNGCPIKAHAFGVFVGIEADWKVHQVAVTASSLAMEAASAASVDDPTTPDPTDTIPAGGHAGGCGNKGADGDGTGTGLNSLATGGKIISTAGYPNGTAIPSNTLANNPAAWAAATLIPARTGLQMICFASHTQNSSTIPVTILVQ